MPIHAVMVRLDHGPDYAERYAKTVEVIRDQGGGVGEVWEEPTSTYVLASPLSASALCDAIYFAAPVYEARDTLVVVNLSWLGAGNYAERGVKYPHTLKSLMDRR